MALESAGNHDELATKFAGNLCVPQENTQETWKTHERDEELQTLEKFSLQIHSLRVPISKGVFRQDHPIAR